MFAETFEVFTTFGKKKYVCDFSPVVQMYKCREENEVQTMKVRDCKAS